MDLKPMSSGKLRSIGDVRTFSLTPQGMSAQHHKVLDAHGYKYKGSRYNQDSGRNTQHYAHPSGHTAQHRVGHGTSIHDKSGKKLNTLSVASDLHGYLTDTHGTK